jgi:hypothetical protein
MEPIGGVSGVGESGVGLGMGCPVLGAAQKPPRDDDESARMMIGPEHSFFKKIQGT